MRIDDFYKQIQSTPEFQNNPKVREVVAEMMPQLNSIPENGADSQLILGYTILKERLLEVLNASSSSETSLEKLNFLPQIEKDFDTWGTILTGRVKSVPTKKEVMDAIKALPPEVVRGINKMENRD